MALDAQPDMANNSALSTLALPYAQDAAVTRHLASFLQDRPFPNKVLFNGGVFKAQPFCQRLMSVLNAWADTEIQASVEPLSGGDLDAAVSLGAAYYRFVKAQNGVPTALDSARPRKKSQRNLVTRKSPRAIGH